MEDQPLHQDNRLQLTDESVSFLAETAKWTNFLAIMGFIGIGFMVLFALFAGTLFSFLPSNDFGPAMPGIFGGVFITVLYLIMALIYFFPVYYLYKFSRSIKQAIAESNTERLTSALSFLKSHYKFIGILTIIMLCLYAVIFIFGMLGALAGTAL